ncbi:YjcZ family sporulation protein [Gracilibacillus sp. S3-1-1]|uniref:YjcZ family sporulation protein n=1 Tax=Gracilibacillus pellucidus TaxID=3095368 RepID=A0ACC6M917_9BACI|nr:YjcZ family sporulation protein [Gracilibacillus sp. S3-1-1]MDX8047420.1 YjcZ family sporulation protein [Gracilibacillus sp. S3-1-1]
MSCYGGYNPCYGYGNGYGYGGGYGNGSGFALIVVLFILLIIVGASFYC